MSTTDAPNTGPPLKDRATINRENAQKSTGPRTEEGKKRSSLNGMRHGLTGQTIVAPKEDLAVYQTFNQRWLHEFLPQGVLEEHMVQSLCDDSWRLNRSRAFEQNSLALGFAEHADEIDTIIPKCIAPLPWCKLCESTPKCWRI